MKRGKSAEIWDLPKLLVRDSLFLKVNQWVFCWVRIRCLFEMLAIIVAMVEKEHELWLAIDVLVYQYWLKMGQPVHYLFVSLHKSSRCKRGNSGMIRLKILCFSASFGLMKVRKT